MRVTLGIPSNEAGRNRIAGWIFFIAWWVGTATLIGGLESAEGLLQQSLAAGVFAIGCAVWLGAYKLSNFRNKAGFIVIAFWMLGPLAALLDFRYYFANLFFWASSAILLLLILIVAVCKPDSDRISEGQ